MNDIQQNKLGMFEKVNNYLTDNAAVLASVTQIADLQSDLNKLINSITDAAGISGSDTTGFTIQKATERTDLETIALKVSRAAAAYFLSIGEPGNIKLADYTKSELDSARDNDLYVKAKYLHKIVQPVEANLTAFNSGPDDVDDLSDALQDFFNVIQVPAEKKGEKAVYTKGLEVLFKEGDTLLDSLDVYMLTFEAVEPLQYALYKAARSIDDSGGGSQNIKKGTAPMESIVNVPFAPGKLQADTVLQLENLNPTGELTYYFSDSPTGGTGTATVLTEVGPDSNVQKVAVEMGYSATHIYLNLFNPSLTAAEWKVEIL
jgi:hypothetical protein